MTTPAGLPQAVIFDVDGTLYDQRRLRLWMLREIYTAYKKGKDIIYTQWLWRWIMAIIKAIPETVFKRLKL